MSADARLAFTVGDPAGIGPEVILRSLPALSGPRPAVYGPRSVLEARARQLGLTLDGCDVVDVPLAGELPPARPSATGGRAAADAVRRAVEDVQAGRARALVTAPLSKEALFAAGYRWPGHTEMLAELTGSPEVAMMFVGGGLRVVLLTIHMALRKVPDALTAEIVERTVRLLHRELPRYGAERRRIALCGLNPHAGEGGLFGDEEQRVFAPACARLRAEGLDVQGPFPADTVFVRAAKKEFDAVVACYHDQGLIPVKLAAFGHAVNVTLGLPFVRTSVDHGTGFDIVERGIADPGSMVEAARLATELVG
jgi:4-hydroxythreonine-4-phosphate dehydrogenase